MRNNFRSLRIGSCSHILDAKEDECFELQIDVAERLLKNIQDTLQAHVKHDVSQAVSKEDIRAIKDNKNLLTEIQRQLLNQAPEEEDTEKMKQHLCKINEIQYQLEKVINSIEETNTLVNDTQQDVVTLFSNAIFMSL